MVARSSPFLIVLGVWAAGVSAAMPSTRPVAPTTPVDPHDRPALIDPRRPAFIPKFARIENPPAGQFAERDYADRYGLPAPLGYGCGCAGYGWGYAGGYNFPARGNGPAAVR